MSGPWRVYAYQRRVEPGDGDAAASGTEYAVNSDDGLICRGIQTRELAEQIAFMGRFTDAQRQAWREQKAQPQPTTENLIDRLGILGEEILAELRHIRSQAGERISSATVKTSTRGTDLEVHSYDDGRLGAALDDATSEYARGRRVLDTLQATNWAATVDGLRERVAEAAGK